MSLKTTFAVLLLGALLANRAPAALSLAPVPTTADLVLADGTNAAPIFAEPTENHAVTRAIGDLVNDIARVTTLKPALASRPTGKNLILIGTLGASKTIDKLADDGKIDVSGVRGQWESYVQQIVNNPLPGVDRALVIAGSDRRGTIYGIYQLSETIGVSPWYWWADVPVHTNKLVALHGDQFKQGPPAVKYRGIFLNDEDWGLRPWAAQTFDTNIANIGPKTYAKVFELLLRLRANYLWPAMHPGTAAFNSFPTNKELADLYGIVMGSSHCEPMLRNNVSEWDTNKLGDYNYVTNRKNVLKYWEERVRENGKFENVYTVGMRGIHDSAMPGGGTPAEQAKRLHEVITDQRDVLRKYVNKEVAAVPQIFVPYKEALDLYRLQPDLPEDITLVWPDDNYGYIRQFSSAAERQRSGGAGVYYHLSYWGAPADYLWLCSTPPALIAEEMCKAYAYGADRLWVVNVGDLKPAEVDTEFFLRLAWNPRAWNGTNINELLAPQFARDFGPQYATNIAGILTEYDRLVFQRKPEHMLLQTSNAAVAPTLFSLTVNGDEAMNRIHDLQVLNQRMGALETNLPSDLEDSTFEFLGYNLYSSGMASERALALTRFNSYGPQSRATHIDYRSEAITADETIHGMTANYNAKAATDGKWMHMFDDNPHGKPLPQPTNLTLYVSSRAILGLAPEGSTNFYHVDRTNMIAGAHLPRFSKLTRRSYFVDVYGASTVRLPWRAIPNAPWIHIAQTNGSGDARLLVSIDWSNAPASDDLQGSIRFLSSTNQEIPLAISVWNPADTSAAQGADFVEDNQEITMEAEHASAILPGKTASWQLITGLGYNGQAMTISPVTAPSIKADADIKSDAVTPCMQYKIWVQTPGDWTVAVRSLPTFPIEAGQPQRYAIAVDDAPPQIVALPDPTSEHDPVWQENVLRNAAFTTSKHTLTAGQHTLKVWMIDPGIVLDTIFATTTGAADLGYVGPPESRPVK